MYEVFFNERRLLLAGENEIPPPQKGEERVVITTREEVVKAVEQFRRSHTPEPAGEVPAEAATMTIVGEMPILWSWFTEMFRLIPAAGGVVKSTNGILFIFRRGKWDLPKGKIDKGETAREAALREVTEETGMKRIVARNPLNSTFHIYLSDYPGKPREWILKETSWFMMDSAGDEFPIPEISEDIEEVRWFRPEEVRIALNNTFPTIHKVIDQAKAVSAAGRAGDVKPL